MRKVAVQVGIYYIQSPGSHFVAQLVDDSLFPGGEAGSSEKPTVIDKDDGISETRHLKTPNQSNHSLLFIMRLD